MKNKILLFSFILFASAASAQSNISFGVKAGLSSTNMRGDAVDNLSSVLDFTNGMISTRSRTGFYGGVFVDVPLGNDLSIEPGIYYTQKGYELNGNLDIKGLGFLGANASSQLQADYIDVPLLLKLKAGNLYVTLGPQFSFLTSANLKSSAGLLGINLLNNKMDVSNNFNKVDMGVTGGIGFSLSKNFSINAAYDYGLQRVDANNKVNAYNQGFKIGLTAGF